MKMKRTVRMPLRRAPQSRTRPPAASLRARAATAEETYDDEEDYGAEEEPNMKFSHALMVVLALHVLAVGGVFAFNSLKARQGPSKASAAAETAAATPEAAPAPAAKTGGGTGRTHTVAANDTLSHIASTYKVSIEAITSENGIDTKAMLRIGQVLKIPASDKVAEKPLPKPAARPDEGSAAAKQAFLATRTTEPATTAKPSGIAAIPQAKPSATPAVITTKVSATPSAPAAAAGDDVYVVARGDNPYNIAKKLHVSYNELIAVNNITDPTKIQIGQKLKVPAKKQP